LSLAIQMFDGSYARPFFHPHISSQLDMDRMDYLNRDSFYTGVAEGTIGAERLIKLLDLVDDALVVEEKGVLSVENFLNARRIMYWQVYLHKTSICVESMLVQVMRRARHLTGRGETLFALPDFALFLNESISLTEFADNPRYLTAFTRLDDFDVWACIKTWRYHDDPVLSALCQMLLDRRLFKIALATEPFSPAFVRQLDDTLRGKGVTDDELTYFRVEGQATNSAYLPSGDAINIKLRSGRVIDIADASDLPNIKALSYIVRRYYVCWAKSLTLTAQRI
ncbi:MAG: phosphohydrolase, partial [Bacteroidetes bacterium]|nr:phosphohydrolase [Fibrella sp.]